MDKNTRSNCFFAWEMRINAIGAPEVIGFMEKCIAQREFGNYIVVSNANDAVISHKRADVREAVNESSLSVPDGISMIFLARLYGYNLKKRVYGQALMSDFLQSAEKNSYSNFFYGSTPETLDLLIKNLRERFPNLKISGSYSPPFRELSEAEDKEIVDNINKLSPDVVWVGLGCPKQQLWMYQFRKKLKVPVMVGVGAAFDFMAGTKAQAPSWIRDNGFEWLFRLVAEPRRLWKRYLIGNMLFIGFFLKEFVRVRLFSKP
jgi:N-acetylglucosaminyldiphosphoundecaprenol N-acetyl-beta-D-mannosaminyltransferase